MASTMTAQEFPMSSSATIRSRDERRWQAVLARDTKADGSFVFAVRTTGVYCRPTCPSRRAKRENVEFFSDCDAAEIAGFRPCKRCSPKKPNDYAREIAEACVLLSESETPPALAILAARAGLSAFHFHRLFKAATGLTPKQYELAHRQQRFREHLRSASTVTDAIYEAGFNSSSRAYERSTRILGMKPREFREGGSQARLRYSIAKCDLGFVLVAASDAGICSILLGESRESLRDDLYARFPKAQIGQAGRDFHEMVGKVIALVHAPQKTIDLPLDIRGTAFQQRVWRALSAIPAGETRSYSEIARAVGNEKAVRAVARACASNPLALAIPCHRAVRNDGSLAGYRWGLKRKEALLARERQ